MTLLTQLTTTKNQLKVNRIEDSDVRINLINEILTEVKNVAVKERTTVEALTDAQVADAIKRVAKRRVKTIATYDEAVASGKVTAADVADARQAAVAEGDILRDHVPAEFRDKELADEAATRVFVMEQKANGANFGQLMKAAKDAGNYDMALLSQIAKEA